MNFGWNIDESCYAEPATAISPMADASMVSAAPTQSTALILEAAANSTPPPVVQAACPALPTWWLVLMAAAAIAGLATRRKRA